MLAMPYLFALSLACVVWCKALLFCVRDGLSLYRRSVVQTHWLMLPSIGTMSVPEANAGIADVEKSKYMFVIR